MGNDYIAPPFSGVPNCHHRDHNQKGLPHPYHLKGTKLGNGYITPRLPNAPRGVRIRSGYLTPIVGGGHKWAMAT